MDDPSPGRNLEDEGEFTDEDISDDRGAAGGGPERGSREISSYSRPTRPGANSWWPWVAVVALLVVGGITYRAFFLTDVAQHAERPPLAAGWMELGSCTFTRSFDGRRQMALNDDQSVEVREPSPPVQQSKEGAERVSTGRWSYDKMSKQYAVTVLGETTNYSLLSQDGIETCILVKGSFEAADLRESWFSASANDEPPDDDSREADRY